MEFPQNIAFSSELQHKKFEDIIRRKILPNRCPNRNALRTIGLFDEVSLLFNRVGWEPFIIIPQVPRGGVNWLFELDG